MVAPQTGLSFLPVYQPTGGTTNASGTNASGTTGGAGGSGYDSLLSSMIGTGINVAGSMGAANAAASGNQAGIGTQQQTLGNISAIYGPQTTLGNEAFGTLGSTLGVGGGPANYQNFLNMPGYQFAVQQGTQAINRAAAANGSLYTPNTLANIGQYVTGTAMGDYNTYVNQLMGAAGFGAQANQTLTGAQMGIGGNISQLQSNIGQNRAGGIAGAAGFLGGGAGTNTSGVANTIANLAGQGYNYLTGGGGGGGNGGGGTYTPTYDPTTGTYNNGFSPGAFGAPDTSPYVTSPTGDISTAPDNFNFDPNNPG